LEPDGSGGGRRNLKDHTQGNAKKWVKRGNQTYYFNLYK